MKLYETNPFARFARNDEKAFFETAMSAADHRIFYVREGSAKITVNSEEFTVVKGCVIYWRSGLHYHVTDYETARLTGINFDFTQINNSISAPVPPVSSKQIFDVIEDINFDDCNAFNSVFMVENAYVLEDKFTQLVEEYEKREIYFSERCSALLKDILITSARLLETSHNSKSAKLAQEVLLYIRNNYQRDITNKKIASLFSYHPNYLNSLVLQHTGTSMHRYLLNYRITKAVELLQTSPLSVTAIAEAVGFSDIKHFSKLFKNTVGYSPAYYKK